MAAFILLTFDIGTSFPTLPMSSPRWTCFSLIVCLNHSEHANLIHHKQKNDNTARAESQYRRTKILI
jgi:hypothetical protein